jgi:hypothetical protein
MSEKGRTTTADLFVVLLSPVLIMALVGSLVFFLVEVLYAGKHGPELRWVLFFSVFGAVLIARISMMGEIASRASLYGGLLGVLVWIALMKYVDYPPGSPAAPLRGVINAGLVALVWWCAHRLTWDCTHLGDDVEVTSEGLLQAAGLDALDPRPAGTGPPEPEPEKDARPESRLNWLERYYRYRARRQKRRAPGVWVVWFSLAALPLFGLGQALIPPEDEGRRRYTFWLLAVYVGSGLGLLLTTCFLGLRQYLRQRKLNMPGRMAAVWLGVGAVMIAALLLLGALLPRPLSETPLFDWRAEGGGAKASKEAKKDGSAGQGEGKPGAKDRGEADKDGARDRGGKGGKGEKEKDRQGGGRDKKDGKQDGGERKGEQGGGQEDRDGDKENDSDNTSLSEALKDAAKWLKWIVFALVALLVLVLVLRGGLRWLANFTQWARDLLAFFRRLWEGLFGGSAEAGAAAGDTAATPEAAARRPFGSFRDPFADGSAARMSAEAVIRYTFAAFEAWAAERDLGRQPGETAQELAERVAVVEPALAADVRRLAGLFARAVYADGSLPPGAEAPLRVLWRRLTDAGQEPEAA